MAESLRSRGVESELAARFLMRLVFCLFAEDAELLPAKLFSRLVEAGRNKPADFKTRLQQLFSAMAKGGTFGVENINHFDGGLFADDEAFDLSPDDLTVLSKVSKLNWSGMEAAIFGTLFERSLDPDKRSQLGAHYTGKDDILLVVEPVLMEPLRRRWAEVKEAASPLAEKAKSKSPAERTKARKSLSKLLNEFVAELASIRVLDPACGSGNFLYIALKSILDLEKEVSIYAANNGLSGLLPRSDPSQLYGIEKNVYAHELASVTVWIGYLQWQNDNGFRFGAAPILKPLDNIKRMDAVLLCDKDGVPLDPPSAPEWPEAYAIIGNPPFVGGNKIRQELGDKYVDDLFQLYGGRVPAFADFVCYWHERARSQIEKGRARRAGLLATQGIRGGANRKVLERIKQTGDIFWAESDREWTLDGATVHVSMIGYDDGTETHRVLDGRQVTSINSDLTASLDVTQAAVLPENGGICFMGPSPKARFDIPDTLAKEMLSEPLNINGRPNSDVVRPVATAVDLVQRSRHMWTIDFGVMGEADAAKYEKPFEHVKQHIYPVRLAGRRAKYAGWWWQYGRPRPEMRRALHGKGRFIATPAVSKHRIFVWVKSEVLCNQGTLVYARDDDYFLGVLQSRVHELWARRKGTQLREAVSGFRYTPTTTFETFPLPWPPSKEPVDDSRLLAVAAAARSLVEKRDAWLNRPSTSDVELKKRTLTTLYNQHPQWLQDAHQMLDAAVLDAYGWPPDITDDGILARLLAVNQQQAVGQAVTASAT